MTPPHGQRAPGLGRRLASALYDLLMLAALVLVATFPFLAVFGDSIHGWRRHALQLWVVAVCGAYFIWFWTRGGQTLPMKTWRIRVVRSDGAPLDPAHALNRYLLALLGLLAAGLGFAWALVDRDRQFLHDRLAGTALVDAASEPPRA
ncbi:MAG: RDD family protein [Pseudomonadota bacterium]|nr:RDD family protein [Pseudomonadota bacterium]